VYGNHCGIATSGYGISLELVGAQGIAFKPQRSGFVVAWSAANTAKSIRETLGVNGRFQSPERAL
jgi:hypothetical protein